MNMIKSIFLSVFALNFFNAIDFKPEYSFFINQPRSPSEEIRRVDMGRGNFLSPGTRDMLKAVLALNATRNPEYFQDLSEIESNKDEEESIVEDVPNLNKNLAYVRFETKSEQRVRLLASALNMIWPDLSLDDYASELLDKSDLLPRLSVNNELRTTAFWQVINKLRLNLS